MSVRELKKLAHLIFRMSRRQVWLGGKVPTVAWNAKQADADWGDWPDDVNRPSSDLTWVSGLTWTLSPEVELGGHRLRVCVSSTFDSGRKHKHHVRIFVDGKIMYPGGHYEKVDWSFWESWSGRLARLERAEGGLTGPVDRRDLLIAEAQEKLQSAASRHPSRVLDVDAVEAVREVEALVQRPGVRLEEG